MAKWTEDAPPPELRPQGMQPDPAAVEAVAQAVAKLGTWFSSRWPTRDDGLRAVRRVKYAAKRADTSIRIESRITDDGDQFKVSIRATREKPRKGNRK